MTTKARLAGQFLSLLHAGRANSQRGQSRSTRLAATARSGTAPRSNGPLHSGSNLRGNEFGTSDGLTRRRRAVHGSGSRSVALCLTGVTLLDPDRITTADCAGPNDGGIHTDVNVVML